MSGKHAAKLGWKAKSADRSHVAQADEGRSSKPVDADITMNSSAMRKVKSQNAFRKKAKDKDEYFGN